MITLDDVLSIVGTIREVRADIPHLAFVHDCVQAVVSFVVVTYHRATQQRIPSDDTRFRLSAKKVIILLVILTWLFLRTATAYLLRSQFLLSVRCAYSMNSSCGTDLIRIYCLHGGLLWFVPVRGAWPSLLPSRTCAGWHTSPSVPAILYCISHKSDHLTYLGIDGVFQVIEEHWSILYLWDFLCAYIIQKSTAAWRIYYIPKWPGQVSAALV
jgi:hypothetical protein